MQIRAIEKNKVNISVDTEEMYLLYFLYASGFVSLIKERKEEACPLLKDSTSRKRASRMLQIMKDFKAN